MRNVESIRLGGLGRRAAWAAGVAVGLLAPWASLFAIDRIEPKPKDLENVGVTERLDEQVPLDLAFVDSTGAPVTLAQYFDGKLPVILTLNYSNCARLCSLQLNGVFAALQRLDWDLGDKWRIRATARYDVGRTDMRDYVVQLDRKQHCLTWYIRYRDVGGGLTFGVNLSGLMGGTRPYDAVREPDWLKQMQPDLSGTAAETENVERPTGPGETEGAGDAQAPVSTELPASSQGASATPTLADTDDSGS